MDNTRSWAPAIGLVALAWLGAAATLVWFLATDDRPGRLLAAIAAIGLLAAALFGSWARPRLAVDEQGITVRGPTGTRSWLWPQVHRVRVVRHRRLGREVAMLEIDVRSDDERGEQLVLLGRMDLNADPYDVLAAIQASR